MQIRPEKFQQQLLGSRALASILCYLFIFVFFWRWGRGGGEGGVNKSSLAVFVRTGPAGGPVTPQLWHSPHTWDTFWSLSCTFRCPLQVCYLTNQQWLLLIKLHFSKKKKKGLLCRNIQIQRRGLEFYVNSHNHKLPLSFIYSPTCWRKLGWSFVVRQTFLEQK